MVLAGIIGEEGRMKTASLINSIFSSTGKKVSVIDSRNLIGLDSLRMKKYINELDKNHTDILILKINLSDVESKIFENLRFDIIIYTDRSDDFIADNLNNYKELVNKVLSLLDEKGIVIVNVDNVELIQFLQGMKYYIVTYGFNSKASITTSSIGDTVFKHNFMCCLQRSLTTKNGLLVEPQEYKVSVESGEVDAYNVLAAATFAIVNDVDLNFVNI